MALSSERRMKPLEEPLTLRQIEEAGTHVLEHLREVGLDMEFFENRMRNLMRTPLPYFVPPEVELGITPLVDIEETKNAYLVRTNLPGVPKDKVEIRFWGQNLDLKAETETAKELEKKSYLYRERTAANYRRRVSFPTPIIPDKADATLENGILTVTVPKLESGEEHRIRIH